MAEMKRSAGGLGALAESIGEGDRTFDADYSK